ncbi:MAG: trypsin-like peptidase domain-containing protein [Anaerolineales bacterium]|nr:trypsin-like peptidase domain-containing protein [Anaerolineales bacterium]
MKSRFYTVLFFGLTVLVLTACGGLTQVSVAPQEELQTLELPAGVVVEPETAVAAPDEAVVVESDSAAPAANTPAQTASADLDAIVAQQQAFIDLYNRVNPAVVSITTEAGQGSGFVYDVNGRIVTNNHVIEGANSIFVTFDDGTTVEAALLGRDTGSDLAVLQIDANEVTLTAVPLADSDALQVGQIVIAIGNPFGLQNTMTTGIISALDRLFPGASDANGNTFSIPNVVQTDAAINPGNSGGPLFDIYGNVVGVNTAIESPVRGNSGVGLAVPSNIVRVVVPQLIDNGAVATPWLGISGQELNPIINEQLNLDEAQEGILIVETIAGGPAAKAGLRGVNPTTNLGGDVIVSVDGRSITAFDDLLGFIVQETAVGQTVQLDILRDGNIITVDLTLEARPDSNQ